MEQKQSHTTKKTTMTSSLILQIVMVSLTGIVISVNENYGTLIPALQHDLGIDGGQVAGLLSTAFFVGMVSTSLLGGLLADRYRTRSLMLGSLMVMTASQMLLPFPPAFVSPLVWMMAMRCIVGLGGGLAFVGGTRAMSTLDKFEGLGQGVFGAASMLGPALSLFITPYLLERFGWRGAFFSWGVVTCAAYVLWSWMPSDQNIRRATVSQGLAFAVFRSPSLWCLGLTFMGTAGWGNAVFSWLAVYLMKRYELPLTTAGLVGALGLVIGVVCRPLGGMMQSRMTPLSIIRLSACSICIGVGVLALPLHSFPLAALGVFLLAFGTATPHAAIFNTAAQVGSVSGFGQGVAQGLMLIVCSPTLFAASPLVGQLFEHDHAFTLAFGLPDLLFGGTAVLSSLLIGPLLTRAGVVPRQGNQLPKPEQAPTSRPLVPLHIATLLFFIALGAFLAGAWLLTAASASWHVVHSLPFVHFLLIGGYLACGGLIAVPVGMALYIVMTITRPKKRDVFIPVTPFVLDLPAEEVQFPSLSGSHHVSGLLILRQGAATTIIVCPGYRRTYRDVLGMCKHLWLAGHNVLVFEYFGHGAIVGASVSLGYREINDFLGAVAYAKQRLPQTRLGALGYSMGAAVAIMGSAQTPEIEALVADSAFATHWSAVEVAVHRTLRFSPLLPAWTISLLRWVTDHLLWWCAGYHFHQVEPVRDIGRIAPRPILLIHGEKDEIVHPDDAKRLYQAANAPKELWLIPDTEHIKGYFTDSRAYTSRILDFFDRALRQTPSMQHSSVQQELYGQKTLVIPTSHAQAGRDQISPAPALRTHKLPAQGTGVQEVLVSSRENRGVTAPGSRTSHTTTRRIIHSALFLAYGRLIYRFRWATVALWLVVLCAALPFARAVPSVLQNSGYFAPQSESHRVDQILTSTLHRPVTQVLVVFQAKTARVSDPAYQREVNGFVARAKTFPHVTQVTLSGPGRDSRSMFVALAFDQDKDLVASRIPDLRRLLPTATSGPAQVFLTGEAATASEIQSDTEADTQQAELIALPVTLLVLLLVFGTIVAGALPLILAAVAVPTSLAIIYLVALHVPSNIFEQSVASIIGLGLAIDYSLILLRRFREELAGEKATSEAVATTIATAGEAILFSGATVIIGFAGLFFIGLPVMTGFAVGGIAVALSANLSALTLLPALLSILGPRVNALRVPGVARLAARRVESGAVGQRSSFWRSLALLVMRRPLPIIALVAVLLVVLGWPALSLNPGLPGATALPQGSEARQGLALLQAQFPYLDENPVYVIVQTQDGASPLTEQNLRRIDALTHWISSQAHVTAVTSLTRLPAGGPALSPQQLMSLYHTGAYQRIQPLRSLVASTTAGNATLIIVRANTVADTSADQALIDRLRTIPPDRKQGLVTLVGGARVVDLDFNRTLYGNFSRAFIFILVATYALLLLTFRSLFLPLKAIVMNVLSVAAAYGALVFVFQEGHFQEFLGFSADGFIDRFIPILLFCILFGLSMDYEVFLLTRIREEWKRTQDNRQAVALGLEKTGGVITSAALLFVIVSSSFLLTSLIVTKELGFGITASVLVDATIIRSLLVPATMQIMGRLNWWLPRFGFAQLPASAPSSPVMVQPGSTQTPRGARSSLLGPSTEPLQDTSPQVFVELVLMQIFAQVLGRPTEQITGISHFFESGGDTQALYALLAAVEERLHVRISPDDVFDHPILFRLAAVVMKRQANDVRHLRQQEEVSV